MGASIFSVFSGFPLWFTVLYALVTLAGLITALYSSKNFNRLLWVIAVAVLPLAGSAITFVSFAVMDRLRKKYPELSFDYNFRKSFVTVPVACAVAGAVWGLLMTGIYQKHYSEKISCAIFPEAMPVSLAVTALFFMFMISYGKYRQSDVCFRIQRISGFDEKSRRSDSIFGCICSEETKSAVPEISTVKRISRGYFKNMIFESGSGRWQYSIADGGEKYGFSIISHSDFRQHFDIESCEYKGWGIVKMTALEWKGSLTEENMSARRYSVWHVFPPLAPLAVETLTSLLFILFSCTPAGILIFNAVMNTFLKFFS